MKKRFFGFDRLKFTGILSILLYLAAGILLLAKPVLLTDLSTWIFTACLLGAGLYWAIRYFRTPPEEAARSYDLAESLISASLGLVILLRQDLFAAVLPLFWGALLILGGFMVLQNAIDFLRLRYVRWWILLIGAVIAITLGVLALLQPGFWASNTPLYVGIALIAVAVIHIVSFILLALYGKGKLPLMTKAAKKEQKEEYTVPSPDKEQRAYEATAALTPEKPQEASVSESADEPVHPSGSPEKPAPSTIFEELERFKENDEKSKP